MDSLTDILNELRETTDINKTLKLLKKLRFKELSPNILLEIKNIISGKQYFQIKTKLKEDFPMKVFAAYVSVCASLMVGALAYIFFANPIITAILALASGGFAAKKTLSGNEIQVKILPKSSQLNQIADYQYLLDQIITHPKEYTKEIKPTRTTQNFTVSDNDVELISLLARVRLIIRTRCSKQDQENYNKYLETMLTSYKKLISEIDQILPNVEGFATDFKKLVFKELEKSINQLIFDLDSPEVYKNRQVEFLITSLNAALAVPNLNEKLNKYIELSNTVAANLQPENINLNLELVTIVAKYYLALIQENRCINLRFFLSQISPVFYDAILNELSKKIMVSDSITSISPAEKPQFIENLSCVYMMNRVDYKDDSLLQTSY